jgi:hypothetical protein
MLEICGDLTNFIMAGWFDVVGRILLHISDSIINQITGFMTSI